MVRARSYGLALAVFSAWAELRHRRLMEGACDGNVLSSKPDVRALCRAEQRGAGVDSAVQFTDLGAFTPTAMNDEGSIVGYVDGPDARRPPLPSRSQ